MGLLVISGSLVLGTSSQQQQSVHVCINFLHVAKAKCIITANERVLTADQVNELKSNVDKALEDSKIKNLIQHVFVAKRTQTDVPLVEQYDVDLDKVSNC